MALKSMKVAWLFSAFLLTVVLSTFFSAFVSTHMTNLLLSSNINERYNQLFDKVEVILQDMESLKQRQLNEINQINDKLNILQKQVNNNADTEHELHILSYFTFPPPGHHQLGYFCNCVRINAQLNINIKYLGNGFEFTFNDKMKKQSRRSLKHTAKLIALSKYIKYLDEKYTIKQQKKSIIIMYVDAYDVIFQRNYSYILKQFIELNQKQEYENKVIWSTADSCFPSGTWCYKFVTAAPKELEIYGVFLNGGGWVGYLDDVNLMFEQFRNIFVSYGRNVTNMRNKFGGDQGLIYAYYFNQSVNINMVLDYYSLIFKTSKLPLFAIEDTLKALKSSSFELRENGWYNKKMDHYPSILHFAGHRPKYWIQFFAEGIVNKLFNHLQNTTNGKIDGEYELEFINYNDTTSTTLKYSELCSEFTNLYY